MKWLRARTRKLSLLALFALAMQIGLSFGHFHHDRAVSGKTTIVSSLASSTSPDSGKDTDSRGDQCAICATIALANALIDSLPPTLPLPVATTASDTLRAAAASDASTHPLGFQSRAPPIA